MTESRVEALIAKLEKGKQKTEQVLSALTPEQWQTPVYLEPHLWTVHDMLAHFLPAEEALRRIAQDVAAGEPGTPEGFDLEALIAEAKQRLVDRSPWELLEALAVERQATLDWVRTLEEETLDRIGQHPALGQITLEAMILAIYGHQLLHMRDLQRRWNQQM